MNLRLFAITISITLFSIVTPAAHAQYVPIPNYQTAPGQVPSAGTLLLGAINSRFGGQIGIAPTLVALPLASMPPESDGSLYWCSDCLKTTPCAGGGSGAFAFGARGVWTCGYSTAEQDLNLGGHSLTNGNVNGVLNAAAFAGATADAQIQAAINSPLCPSSGCIISCSQFTGAQTFSAGIMISKPVEIDLGGTATYTYSGAPILAGLFHIKTNTNGVVIRAHPGAALFVTPTSGTPMDVVQTDPSGNVNYGKVIGLNVYVNQFVHDFVNVAAISAENWTVRNNIISSTPDLSASASESGSTVTITTSAVHNLAVGSWVVVHGMSVAGYDGIYQVAAAPTSTTFTYASNLSGLGAGSGGAANGMASGFLLDLSAPSGSGGAADHASVEHNYMTHGTLGLFNEISSGQSVGTRIVNNQVFWLGPASNGATLTPTYAGIDALYTPDITIENNAFSGVAQSASGCAIVIGAGTTSSVLGGSYRANHIELDNADSASGAIDLCLAGVEGFSVSGNSFTGNGYSLGIGAAPDHAIDVDEHFGSSSTSSSVLIAGNHIANFATYGIVNHGIATGIYNNHYVAVPALVEDIGYDVALAPYRVNSSSGYQLNGTNTIDASRNGLFNQLYVGASNMKVVDASGNATFAGLSGNLTGGNACAGTVALTSGSPSTATVTNACVTTACRPSCTDETSASAIKCAPSAGSLALTGPNTVTDTVAWACQ